VGRVGFGSAQEPRLLVLKLGLALGLVLLPLRVSALADLSKKLFVVLRVRGDVPAGPVVLGKAALTA
jgi:hypothetical protein